MTKNLALLIAILPLVSCQKTKEVDPNVERFEKQKDELDALQVELTDLHIKVAAAKTKGPKKPVEDLRASFKKSDSELKKINEEFETLKASEEETIKALEDYKEKYPLSQ